MRFDRKIFFKGFRAFYRKHCGSGVPQAVVDSVEFLLGAFEKQHRITQIEQAAYALATIAHETAWTFAPIKEYRSRAGSKGRANQDRYWLTGYYGRGYVQLTWERNYKAMSGPTGVDLVAQPDLAMVPSVAFDILIAGMTKGTFTGKKLDDYIRGGKVDYVNARRIINGTDKAAVIAGYAAELAKILKEAGETGSGGDGETQDDPTEVPETPAGPADPVEVKKEDTSLFVKLGAAVTAVTGFGINVGSLVQTKLEAMTVQQIVYMIAALGLIAGAIWWYRKAAKGAQMRTMQLVEKAANPNAATVRLVK